MFSAQERVYDPSAGTEITCDKFEELLAILQSEEPLSTNSGSGEINRKVQPVDERKRRRMISNRESAKRSRLRKKRWLENLTEEVNRLSFENRELKNRLDIVLRYGNDVSRENNRLKTESVCLKIRLLKLYRVLINMQKSHT
ncbi:PREDICTED: bZIP transcription factor 2 [Tarenaya hassleriana]|uniref:bZIP transcription factor 2 n=1 Tax=Tarenaya hassleriana TaxID=28532 RepID=UPI00053C4700|nr:PREDICTED: bZIP transcription factor 2 [Tarenaya hassleriana]